MLGAVMFGHRNFQPVIDAIIRLAERTAREPRDFRPDDNAALHADIDQTRATPTLRRRTRSPARRSARQAGASEGQGSRRSGARSAPDGIDPQRCRRLQASRERHRSRPHPRHRQAHRRPRSVTVRPIACEVGVLPRTHGSALFTRGETQALVVTTLGTGEDEQYIDALEGTYKETFLLHYNFPPFSVGETGRLGGAGRREIGHGKLAWRAIHPMLPPRRQFPYTIRVVSEITEFERLVIHGDCLRLLAGADGRRRTA